MLQMEVFPFLAWKLGIYPFLEIRVLEDRWKLKVLEHLLHTKWLHPLIGLAVAPLTR